VKISSLLVHSVPERPKRLPTEFLPNSADSTPGITRQTTWTAETSTEETGGNQPKLISVFFFTHDGVPADNPYCIKNKQMVCIMSFWCLYYCFKS